MVVQLEVPPSSREAPVFQIDPEKHFNLFEQIIGQPLERGKETWAVTGINCSPQEESDPIVFQVGSTNLSLTVRDYDMVPHDEQAFLGVFTGKTGQGKEPSYYLLLGRGRTEAALADYRLNRLGVVTLSSAGDIRLELIKEPSATMILPQSQNGELTVLTSQERWEFQESGFYEEQESV
ncbi:MAG: hypothetical protein ACOY0S_01615 [Patescibacteria group bacterium]